MQQGPYSRYTRERTWAALYSQHSNAGYALVPYSATNNSLAVIRCASAEEVQTMMQELLARAEECAAFYASRRTPDQAPPLLARARHAVVLAKSSHYYHYHLADHPELRLVICGLHDSYLHLPVWETRTNTRYAARLTSVPLTSPDFDQLRRTQFGHRILVGALLNGDATALAFKKTLPTWTQRRLTREVQELQETRYRGRPLAFLTDAERQIIGAKISDGLKRYHRLKAV